MNESDGHYGQALVTQFNGIMQLLMFSMTIVSQAQYNVLLELLTDQTIMPPFSLKMLMAIDHIFMFAILHGKV